MNKISEIFREFAPEYLDRFGASVPKTHRKTIGAILSCRTQAHGLLYYECEACGKIHAFYRSCGNRHCPACQNHKTRQWMARQIKRQLPGHHFMVTFTVPEELRNVIRSNQKACYGMMFAASSQAMSELVGRGRWMTGKTPGFFGVLHTWGRQLQYHPHIHYLVPGGAVSGDGKAWHPTSEGFLLPYKALSALFRKKLRGLMEKAGLLHNVCPDIWFDGFNVDVKPAGGGQECIKYLTPYIFKVAISQSRIEKVEGREVTITYKKKGSRRPRRLTLEVMEFMRRYLQHVLPTGFMKVRYYGFMSPASVLDLKEVRKQVMDALQGGDIVPPPQVPAKPSLCKSCGGVLKYVCGLYALVLPPDDDG